MFKLDASELTANHISIKIISFIVVIKVLNYISNMRRAAFTALKKTVYTTPILSKIKAFDNVIVLPLSYKKILSSFCIFHSQKA